MNDEQTPLLCKDCIDWTDGWCDFFNQRMKRDGDEPQCEFGVE